MLVKIIQEDR